MHHMETPHFWRSADVADNRMDFRAQALFEEVVCCLVFEPNLESLIDDWALKVICVWLTNMCGASPMKHSGAFLKTFICAAHAQALQHVSRWSWQLLRHLACVGCKCGIVTSSGSLIKKKMDSNLKAKGFGR